MLFIQAKELAKPEVQGAPGSGFGAGALLVDAGAGLTSLTLG